MGENTINLLSKSRKGYVKKAPLLGVFFILQKRDKPDSVLPWPSLLNLTKVVSIINLHNVLPQNVKPSTRPQLGTCIGDLFEVAAHRDCPFHSNLIVSSLLL